MLSLIGKCVHFLLLSESLNRFLVTHTQIKSKLKKLMTRRKRLKVMLKMVGLVWWFWPSSKYYKKRLNFNKNLRLLLSNFAYFSEKSSHYIWIIPWAFLFLHISTYLPSMSFSFFLNMREISVEKNLFFLLLLLLIFSKWNRFMIFFCFLPCKTILYYWLLNEIFFLAHTHTHILTFISLIRDLFWTLLLEITSLKFSLCFHFPGKLPSFDDI